MGQIEIDHAWSEMLYHLGDVVNGVQDGAEIRESAFAKAEVWARELTRLLKNSESLPRENLHRLNKLIGMLEGGAEHSVDKNRVLSMAGSSRRTLGLILAGECFDDYVVGVPRIS